MVIRLIECETAQMSPFYVVNLCCGLVPCGYFSLLDNWGKWFWWVPEPSTHYPSPPPTHSSSYTYDTHDLSEIWKNLLKNQQFQPAVRCVYTRFGWIQLGMMEVRTCMIDWIIYITFYQDNLPTLLFMTPICHQSAV